MYGMYVTMSGIVQSSQSCIIRKILYSTVLVESSQNNKRERRREQESESARESLWRQGCSTQQGGDDE